MNQHTAAVILAEVGPAVARFPTAAQLASWAGLCPGNHERGGRRFSGKTRPGTSWLRRLLVQAAQAAVKQPAQPGTFLQARYRRLQGRLGAKKALVALAHRVLVIVDHVIARQEDDHEVALSALDPRQEQRREQRLVAQLQGRGYTVPKDPVPVAG